MGLVLLQMLMNIIDVCIKTPYITEVNPKTIKFNS